ncbi:anti-sigma factor [Streptomyces minutiscleroticus]|uniref:anti-sigma factor n=1 Tax=Streptomyces minutiscleroticus TaxID=68238 RepID=UPI003325A46F
MRTIDLHTLTGAYALHALDDEDRAAFEHHLRDCPSCAQEVRELAATAVRLGLAAATPPPPALKDEVMRRIAAVRQEPPPTAAPARSAVRRAGAARLPRWALAACLAAAAALGGTTVWQYDRARDARAEASRAEQRTQRIAEVVAAPDARTRTEALGGGARATVVVSQSRDEAVFAASGLAEPPSGKVYQLWFDDGGTMRPAGLMDPARGSGAVLMEGRVGDAAGMGVTVEPAGGSERPTSAPLALVEFPV